MSMPTIPGYEVTELVGRGGMGRVYRATDHQLRRTVAIKMLVDADDPELLSRFESEARAVASLAHPNITRLFEFARTESGTPYCVMEYLGGGTLADVISGRPMPWKQAAQIIETLANAVQAAHRQGILHRDLKPANILIAGNESPPQNSSSGSGLTISSERVNDTLPGQRLATSEKLSTPTRVRPDLLRISDFGLARKIAGDSHVTRTGQILGTPAYMAPEQASGMVPNPGPGVDIYSLGAILFELLTGRPPFVAADGVEIIMLLLAEDPVPPRNLQPTIPGDLETICLKCLEKKASRRYLTAQELAEDLSRFLEGLPIHAKPVSRFEHWLKWSRRNPWKAIAALLFTVSGVTALIGVAALQSAYAEVTRANNSLSAANSNLTKVNSEIRQTRDLARDALDGIVDRLRDELHDVPGATPVMMATSRESLALHRRMYTLQPDDIEMARSYVSSLYSHVLLEWLHGSREESAATFSELQSAFQILLPKYPSDAMLRITHLKLLLDRGTYLPETGAAAVSDDLRTVDLGVASLLETNPDLPEALKLASLFEKRRMTDAGNAGDYARYAELAKKRVEYARRFAEAISEGGESSDRENGIVWLAQAQRDLASGLLLNDDAASAVSVLQDALTQMEAVSSSERAMEFERAQLNFAMARTCESLQDPRQAISFYSRALSNLVRLVQDYPDDTAYRSTMASALIRSAALSFAQGSAQVSLEQLATAESQVNEILRRAPNHADALLMQAALPKFRDQIRLALPSVDETTAKPADDQQEGETANPR